MLKNYFKVAIRNIQKQKFFSIINILGLSIGMAGALFISLYIYDELNFEKFNDKADRIYRVNLHGKLSEQEIYVTNSCPPMYKALVDEIPEVEQALRVRDMGEWIFRNETMSFKENKVYAADSNFFQVFDFEMTHGNPETALTQPNTMVLSSNLAVKYFGSETAALDKTLNIGNDKTEYKVTGVMENTRLDSHLQFNVLLSINSFPFLSNNNWLNNTLFTYYLLQEGANPADVDKKLEPIMARNVTPVMQQFVGKSLEEFRAAGGIYEYTSFPLTDIHLYSEYEGEPTPVGDISYVYIMAGIGVFILLLACINFMNLTTARSAGRAKEVGLRKTLGSLRKTLITQFLAESMIYSLFAGFLALVAVYLLIPSFNSLAGKGLTFAGIIEPVILLTFIGIILLVGVLAGSYPAFYLTSFKITEVLKGKLRSGMKSGAVRSILVTFQFWISIVLVICTFIVFQQLEYVQDKNLGIDKEHILMIEDMNRIDKDAQAFKTELVSNSFAVSASFTNNSYPGTSNNTIFRTIGSEQDYLAVTHSTDYDHPETMGFDIVEGRYFSRDFPSDTAVVVVNEAAVRMFGWEKPLESKIINYNNGPQPVEMDVVGVMKDFNFEDLKSNVRPLILLLNKEPANNLYLRYSGEKTENVLSTLQSTWDKYGNGDPLEYSFLNEQYDEAFRAEQRLGKVFTVFTMVAIFIACLGLFGLSAFMAEQRTKEIGIRKVMGASVWTVTTLMSKDFLRLVVIAFLLSIYPAYYAMDMWLNDFAFRIDMNYWIFGISGVIAIGIAYLTVSYQSFKAARINPVESIKYE